MGGSQLLLLLNQSTDFWREHITLFSLFFDFLSLAVSRAILCMLVARVIFRQKERQTQDINIELIKLSGVPGKNCHWFIVPRKVHSDLLLLLCLCILTKTMSFYFTFVLFCHLHNNAYSYFLRAKSFSAFVFDKNLLYRKWAVKRNNVLHHNFAWKVNLRIRGCSYIT